MADVTNTGEIQITPESLKKSYIKFRKDLITIPQRSLEIMRPYVQIRPGVRYKETVGEMSGNAELRPFHLFEKDDEKVAVNGRDLETFLGSVVKPFNPNSVAQSIYGSDTVQGEALKNVPITALVYAYLLKQIGENLLNVVFTAVRNPSGKKTKDLFNGFQTIAKKEIEDGNISEERGNLHYIEKITQENAIDVLEDFVTSADSKLTDLPEINLICSRKAVRFYQMAYRERFGNLQYNSKFDKMTLDVASNVNLVPLPNVPDDYLQLSTKKNVMIGLCTSSLECKFDIEKSLDSHFLLDFVGTMFFGTQFESISPELLHIGMVKETSAGSDEGN